METSQPPPPPDRSKRLHNFTLPYLRWGHQRFLRCVKSQHHHSPPPSSSSLSPDPKFISSSDSAPGFAPLGEIKLGLDLRYDAKFKVSVLGNRADDSDAGVVAARPWNLRTRRAACNQPRDESNKLVDSSRRLESGAKRGNVDDVCKEKNPKIKFSVSLLREEIEEDFAAMIGKRPPRRPKKRPRIVQKQLNSLFPGLWLTEEVTADSYNVPETLET